MNFFGDKRLWYAIVAVIVVVIVAAVFWSRNQTMESSVPAATNPPATTPAAPSTTPPKRGYAIERAGKHGSWHVKRTWLCCYRVSGGQVGRDAPKRPESVRAETGIGAPEVVACEVDVLPTERCEGLAPKVLALIGQGRSYRLVGRELGLSKNTVAAIAKRSRPTTAPVS